MEFASKREEAVAVAVAEGSSAAWRRGRVVGAAGVGSTERGLGCGWLRTRWRPVTRGRDVVIKAIAAFAGAPPAPPAPAPPFLQPGPAARAAAPQRPVDAGEEDGVTHVLGYVWLGSAGKQRGQGRGSLPASSPVKDIVMKMDRAAVAAAPTACHYFSDATVAHSSSSSSELSCSGSRDSMYAMICSIPVGRSSLIT